jgi:hypothetical protein
VPTTRTTCSARTGTCSPMSRTQSRTWRIDSRLAPATGAAATPRAGVSGEPGVVRVRIRRGVRSRSRRQALI